MSAGSGPLPAMVRHSAEFARRADAEAAGRRHSGAGGGSWRAGGGGRGGGETRSRFVNAAMCAPPC